MSQQRRREELFVNNGLARWERIRAEWVKPLAGTPAAKPRAVVARPLDTDDVLERIFSSKDNGQLAAPVPLGQMIDLLVDVWEADGLFD